MDIDIYRLITGIRDTGTPEGAKRELLAGVPRHTNETDEWAREVRDRLAALVARTNEDLSRAPPTLDERAPPEAELRTTLATAREMMLNAPDVETAARVSDVVASYRDLFPGVVGDEVRTPRASLLRQFRSVAQAVGEGVAQGGAEAIQSFVRARSYAALRGFFKIGGVLIGMPPHGGHAPSIVALDWIDAPSGITLHLKRADGTVLHYGPFRAAIVQAALAYAADGRPTTATMPPAYIGRQVLLHPALVDNALGCEARLLDQFVDGSTGGARERVMAEARIRAHEALYLIAWATQFEALDRIAAQPDDDDEVKRREHLRHEVPNVLGSQTLSERAKRVFAEPAAWPNADVSPVTTKTAFFDKALVAEIGQCLTGAKDLDSFKGCITAQKPGATYISSRAWLLYPPRLRPESGVRELAYAMTEDLDFLDLKRTRSESLWPFDFMLQITFESPPEFVSGDAAEFDKDPFEFPALKPWIHQAVAAAILSAQFAQMEATRVLTDLREFAVLQRFFRLALAGDLGQTFPLNRLIDIAKVAPNTPPPAVRTMRWNIFSADQHKDLVDQGLGPRLGPLGYERDYQQFLKDRGRCPAILP